jgi:hypothetical protein
VIGQLKSVLETRFIMGKKQINERFELFISEIFLLAYNNKYIIK